MTKRLAIMSERLAPITEIERRIPSETGAELRLAPLATGDEILAAAGDADVLIIGATEPFTAEALNRLPRLRCVVRRGVGVNNVDLEAATRLGVGVAFVPAASVEEVSDQALALLLAAERRIVAVSASAQAGDIAAAGARAAQARRFSDLVLGIVGFGRIGRALARKAVPIFDRVVASDPFVSAAEAGAAGAELLHFEDLLRTSDLISLHAPATPENHHLIDAKAFAVMRSGAVLVNTARGELVDESALLDALQSGQVAVAALDVTEPEPVPEDSPLRNRSDVILTGHTAAKGVRSSASLRTAAADAAIAVLKDQLPEFLANPEVLHADSNRLGAGAARPAQDPRTSGSLRA